MIHCSGPNCNRPVLWATTPAGKPMIFDKEPLAQYEQGCYVIHETKHKGRRCGLATPIDEGPYYMVHWATCPDADTFRRRS